MSSSPPCHTHTQNSHTCTLTPAHSPVYTYTDALTRTHIPRPLVQVGFLVIRREAVLECVTRTRHRNWKVSRNCSAGQPVRQLAPGAGTGPTASLFLLPNNSPQGKAYIHSHSTPMQPSCHTPYTDAVMHVSYVSCCVKNIRMFLRARLGRRA